ncbi:TIGR03943 family protein [Clostridium sp. FP2]|uniref:TIGR03943 family putative permease subunit n=1 Tax=Clostridium sp. FP2 TaxID=2724481 RepID=UPI0013E94185|nr:TIGR03943 family protein [Clostridium sp. FP2]MBZ9625233.1 TIGR03943 family protein [Clostridium sp. FP2]
MKKKLNLNELIWFIILTGFTCYFYMIISTNKITLFVHPKMVKYVKFALYFFITLLIFQGKNIYSFKKAKRLKIGYIMFLIPLTLGFILKPVGMSTYSAINKGFSLNSQLKISNLKHKHKVLADGTEVCEHNEEHINSIDGANVSSNKSLENIVAVKAGTIDITKENFIKSYEDIYGNPHNYVGRVINTKGFIYKQKGLNEGEFILSRIIVSCCAADAQLLGILCGYPEKKSFTEGTWVNVEGTLGEREYVDSKSGQITVIPIIKVNKIEKIDKHNNEYIYN